MTCVTGKRCFEDESIALEALIQHHIINNYPIDQGPKTIYQCSDCGAWHFTSKGEKHEVLLDEKTLRRIKRERQANYWERKLM